ncbi:MAG: hypothetical protein ACE5JU_18965, partial [Candidatus Binatia bacterium]
KGVGRVALKALTYWLGPVGFLPRNHTFRNRAFRALTGIPRSTLYYAIKCNARERCSVVRLLRSTPV